MQNIPPVWHSLGHAVLVYAYIACIALFLSNAQTMFGDQKTFLIPIAMLMLLVLSVAIMGILIFGNPVLLYLDGKKKEGLMFLGYIIGWLFLLTVLAFGVLAVMR
jgi:hypothetical protein